MITLDRRLLVAGALLLGLGAAPALAAPIKVSVAAEPYPPFASKSAAGDWEGFEVDLAKAVCKAASLDCDIVETAWDGIIPALTSKKIDVIFASMTITPDREKTIDFSIPYYNTPAEFIAPKGDKVEATRRGHEGQDHRRADRHDPRRLRQQDLRQRLDHQDLQHPGRGQLRPRGRPARRGPGGRRGARCLPGLRCRRVLRG